MTTAGDYLEQAPEHNVRRVRRVRRVRHTGPAIPRLDANYRRGVLTAFTFVLLISFCAQSWSIAGLPIRAICTVALLVYLGAKNWLLTKRAAKRHKVFLYLTVAIALLGSVVSLANGMTPPALGRALAEIHLQTAINLLLGAVVAEICGVYPVIAVFTGVTLLSAAFAIAQFMGVEAAWTVRDTIAKLTHEVVKYGRERPPGLSLSTIALPTQLCLALAAVVIGQQRRNEARGTPKRMDPVVAIAVAVFVFACLAGGNRSPILGGLAFLLLYAIRNRPKLLFIAIPVLIFAIPAVELLFEYLQSTGLRSFETGDKSSEGRSTLAYYGWLLFKHQPLGYGLGFDPPQHWSEYWRFIQNMPNPSVIQTQELHNYILNMLNYYGVTILAAVPVAVWMMRRYTAVLLCFIPYITHIAFHNYGPFQNDTFIMFVMAMAAGPRRLIEPAGAIVEKGKVRRRRRGSHRPPSALGPTSSRGRARSEFSTGSSRSTEPRAKSVPGSTGNSARTTRVLWASR